MDNDDDDIEDGIMDDAGMNDDGMDEGVIHHQYPFKKEMISCLSSVEKLSIHLSDEGQRKEQKELVT